VRVRGELPNLEASSLKVSLMGNPDEDVRAMALALLEQADALAARMFEVLAREPAVIPALTPELAAAGKAVARADLAHELRCLADGATLPQTCPEEIRATARRTVALGAPLTFPLQCYRAGHRVLWDAWREIARGPALEIGGAFFFDYADRCCALLVREHANELEAQRSGVAQRRLALVRRVLAGAVAPTHVGDYPLGGKHQALVCSGPEAHAAARSIALASGRPALLLELDEETTWLWLAGETRPPAAAREATIGVGVAESGADGFARSHRQAQQALRIALARNTRLAAYPDVALDVVCSAEPTVAADFAAHVLAPLDDAPVLQHTLAAWLEHGMSASAAASHLGVTQRTVNNRLRSAEARLGGRVRDRATTLETALRARSLAEASHGD
jgi:hypothetical protein